MYKKSLAVLLSVLLVATSLITLFSFSASANSLNLVADGKFENGFSGWQVFNNSGNSSAAFTVVEDGDNHVLSAVSGLSMFKQVELEAGVEYTVGFDFKFDTNASVPATYDSFYRAGFVTSVTALSGSIFVGPYASGNKYYSIYPSQKNDPNNWKSHTFTFTPSSNMTTYFVIGSFNNQGEANFFVDNVYLAKSTDLVTVTTVAGSGGSVSGGVKTFKGDLVTVKALPSSGYEFDGWYNAASEKLSSDLNYTFDANENVELTAKFKVNTYNPNLIVNGDFSKQNLDDFEVFKNGNNSSADFAFTAFGEDYILSAKAGHSLFKKVDLKGGTSYTMSFDFRFTSADVPAAYDSFYRAGFVNSVAALSGSIFVGPNTTGNKYHSIYPNQKTAPTTWKNHSFTFTPATDMSVWAVVGSFNHEGVADFELDNWMLYKTSDLITVTAVADEGGSANGTATVLSGEKVVLTATAEEGYEFLGWYNADVLVSTDAEYVHTATETITLVAKFKSTAPISNYIVNGDFENPFTTDKISDVSLTAVKGKWGRIYSGVARMEATETVSFTSYDSAELNGTRYITSGATKDSNQFIRAFGQYVELPAGDYVLEFDAKSTASNMFVVSVKKGQEAIISNDLVYNYLDESLEWKHYKINFTSDAEGLYQIAFGGNDQGKGAGDFSIDNVSIEVYVEETPGYIVNGDFEKPFTTDTISNVSVPAVTGKWGKIYSGVARMEATETESFTSYDSAELNGTRYITSGATKDSNQFIRAFGQYAELPAGDYVLEFDAKSTASNMFVVSVKKGQESITANDLVYNYLDESLEWKHYKINFTADAEGLYQIAFGGNEQGKGAGDFSIDNVSLDVYVEETLGYIVNGDFEKPFTTDTISNVSVPAVTGKWGKIYSGVARMEATETESFTSYDSAEFNGTRYITSGATKDSNQFIRAFGQYTNLSAGDYVLEFDAKSTVSNMFVVSVKKGQEAITANDLVYNYLDESLEWKHYKIKFTADTADMYQIAFGGNDQGKGAGDFSIDNVSLDVYVEENPSYIVNGDFEKPFTTDKISDVNLSAISGKWGRIYSGVARMEATETENFTSYDSAELNGTRYITSGATKDENQYIRAFGQYTNLPAGDYVLEFDAKSTASNMFVVSVKKGQESINQNDLVYHFLEESAEWKHYTIRFSLTEEGLYQISFGGNAEKKGSGDFAIDNVGLFNAEGYVTVTAVTDGGGKVTYPAGDLELGSTATVIATADVGYIFAGWYKGTELVSADASYTFIVTESVELKAKFDLNLGDDDAIIKNGKFDIGSTAGWNVVKNHTGSATEVVVDADTGSLVAHTTGNGAIAFMQKVNLTANVEYFVSFDFKFDDYESIPETYNSFYRSGFLADPNGGLGNANFVGPNIEEKNNVYVSLSGIIVTEDKNAWNSISYTFTPATDMETWFVIGAFNEQGVSNYSIDNIAIAPKKDVTGVTVAAISHGGSGKAVSNRNGIVSPGETVTLTATPNAGSIFGGWYINGNLISENAEFNYEVVGNHMIYARFLDATNPESNQMLDNSDFATGDLSGWGKSNIAFANNKIEYVTDGGESYVKLGECDMLYQPVELEPYSTYMIRVTTRIPDLRKNSYQVHDLGFFRFGISELAKPNVLQSGALEKDPYSYTSALSGQCDCEPNNRYHCAMQWGTYTYTYSNNSPDTVLANVVIGTPYCKSDLHIKKFEFVKYVDGIVDFKSDILYGEDFFNNVKNPSFEENTTDADWGAKLPNGWSIKNEGVKGTNYLSVSGSESKTYTFKVRTGTTYVVAFSLRTKEVGNASVSIVDDNGNPWGDSFKLVTDTAVFSPKADGKWQRMGAHLYIADNAEGYTNINIKITAGSNVLDIDEVTITKLGYATHAENPNVYVDNSFDYDNPRWYDPTTFYKLPDGATVEGAVDDPYANKN